MDSFVYLETLWFFLGITFYTLSQLLWYSYNQVVKIVYMVWSRSTIIIPLDPNLPSLLNTPLINIKRELKRQLDFDKFLPDNFYLLWITCKDCQFRYVKESS